MAVPIYVYRLIDGAGCEKCRGDLEVRQSFSDKPLVKCPDCGAPVEKIITGVNVITSSTKSKLSNKSLKEHGFQKLVREEKGVYHKEV